MTGLLIAGLIFFLVMQMIGIVLAVALVGKPGGKSAGLTALTVAFSFIYVAIIAGALAFVLNH